MIIRSAGHTFLLTPSTPEQRAEVERILRDQVTPASALMGARFLRELNAVTPLRCPECRTRDHAQEKIDAIEKDAVLS